MRNDREICSRCVSDTTIPEIRFDAQGVCNYCKIHDEMDKQYPLNAIGQQQLDKIVAEIKRAGRDKEHDCIVGVSGGTDSTYSLYTAVKLGLRPLAVHFDNGWNSEIAVSNIKNATAKLNVDLHTYVVDWEEFKDLQISYLKASVPDVDIPTDVAIHAILHKIAAEENIRYILNGHSFRTEGLAPLGWTYMDGKYIASVQRILGKAKLKTFPNITLADYLYYTLIKGIKVIPILNYVRYNKSEAKKVLEREVDWTYYGGHHHESTYTYFIQSYLLPKKFNIDKRKIEYSALIRSGQITRDQALQEIQENPYPYDEEVVEYTISKLGLSKKDFEEILNSKPKSFHDYPTYYPTIKALKTPITVAFKLNLIPQVLYYKFFA